VKDMSWRVCALAVVGVLAASAQRYGSESYHAKIMVEEGTPPNGTPQIIVGLGIGLDPACRITTVFGNGTVTYITRYGFFADRKDADACPVTISLPGYRKTQATLRNDAVIILKRLGGDHEGSTVSMTEVRAPEDARKAFAKGLQAVDSKKWPKAQIEFERAISIYPDYASAYSELGQVELMQTRPKEARDAFEKAIQIDPKYVKAYVQLARLDFSEHRMEDAAAITTRALELKPTDYPEIYFFHAVANFNLKHLDVAEVSARRAVDLDSNHELPRAESLLGAILAAKGDRAGAIEHWNKYLELSPKATDAGEVKQRIAAIREGK
jgi:tetratricopeptide (TPR) repeat protein